MLKFFLFYNIGERNDIKCYCIIIKIFKEYFKNCRIEENAVKFLNIIINNMFNFFTENYKTEEELVKVDRSDIPLSFAGCCIKKIKKF